MNNFLFKNDCTGRLDLHYLHQQIKVRSELCHKSWMKWLIAPVNQSQVRTVSYFLVLLPTPTAALVQLNQQTDFLRPALRIMVYGSTLQQDRKTKKRRGKAPEHNKNINHSTPTSDLNYLPEHKTKERDGSYKPLLQAFSDINLYSFEAICGQLELVHTPIKLLLNWYMC